LRLGDQVQQQGWRWLPAAGCFAPIIPIAVDLQPVDAAVSATPASWLTAQITVAACCTVVVVRPAANRQAPRWGPTVLPLPSAPDPG